jgi:hypothetical protein
LALEGVCTPPGRDFTLLLWPSWRGLWRAHAGRPRCSRPERRAPPSPGLSRSLNSRLPVTLSGREGSPEELGELTEAEAP